MSPAPLPSKIFSPPLFFAADRCSPLVFQEIGLIFYLVNFGAN